MKKTSLAASMALMLLVGLAWATVGADAAAARPPAAPTRVVALASDASAEVSWRAPGDTGGSAITGYVVTASPGGASVTTTAVTSVHVGGLKNGRRYSFVVAAINAAGTGARSLPSGAVTPSPASVPGQPRAVKATGGNTRLTVTWKAPAGDGRSPVTGYRVLVTPGNAETTVSGDAHTATLTGLTNGVRYRAVVAAVNAVGRGRDSERTPAVTPRIGPPEAPASVRTAAAGKGVVHVSWEPGDDGGSPITGYDVSSSPGGAVVKTSKTSVDVKGLRSGTAYVFTVRARNAKGRGPGTATAATRPDVTVARGTVVLSAASLSALSEVTVEQTLIFADAPDQVRKLAVGNVIVADVSGKTPQGLLRKVAAVSTDAGTTTVTTAEASLDDAITDGGVAMATELDGADVDEFRPARDGVRMIAPKGLAKIGAPSLTVSLDIELAKQGNKTVTLSGSQSITPHVSFDASVRCCFHTDTHFNAEVEVQRTASLTAEISKTISGPGIKLGQFDFVPIRFAVGPVPVVIVPRMELTLEASGKISAGITTAVSETTRSGVDITSRDSRVTARPVNTRTVSFQQPTVFAAASLTIGPRVRLSLMLYGVVGPFVQFTVNLIDLKADTGADHFVTLQLSGSIGAGFQLSLVGKRIADWERDPLVGFTLPLYQSGPFMGVTIAPDPATVQAGGTLTLTATVARSPVQTVNWSIEQGGGSITPDGAYTAPDDAGFFTITATSPANGLKPETKATVDVEVTAKDPGPDPNPDPLPAKADVLIVGTGDFGSTTGAEWLSDQLRAAGYSVGVYKQDALPPDLSGYGQIWDVSTSPLSDEDIIRFADYIKGGRGAYLTGERPCCESINAADSNLVKGVVPAATDLRIGGLDDPFLQTGPVDLNPAAPSGLTTKPFEVATWTVSAPGGLAGVPAGNVLASVGETPVAAAWGPEDVTGKGRLALLMDINWVDPTTMDSTTAGHLAQNLALYLSGKSEPPAAPAAVVKPNAKQKALVGKHSPSAADD